MTMFAQKYWKPLLCSILIIIGTSTALIAWRELHEYKLPNGGMYSEAVPYYALNDAVLDEETGRYLFTVSISPKQAEKLTLVLTRAKNFVFYVDGEPYLSLSAQDYRRLRSLPVLPPLYDPQSGILRLEWSADNWSCTEGYGLFLGDTGTLTNLISNFFDLQTVCMGILLLMLLHALSLLLGKRDERYLLVYSLYLTSILLVILLNSDLFKNIRASVPLPYFIIVTTLVALQKCINVLMCYRLLNIPMKGAARHLLSWRGIVCICVIYCFLCNYLRPDVSTYFAETIRLLLTLAGALVLICGCTERKPYAWMLLAGYSISMGLIIMASLINLGVIKDWLIFVLLRAGRIEELPFAFSCMFCINRHFADKFKESEKLAAELTELNRSLDEKVEERTKAYVAERQQRHSMMLNIFHDLRSPLFILKGCTEIMDSEFPQEHEMLTVMRERIHFLSDLTEDLFLLAKLEDDEMPFDCMQVSLNEVLRTTAKAHQVSAQEKNISLTIDADLPCLIWGNKERLERAFENLVGNAIHYTPQGGSVCISLTLSGEMASVAVTDSGKGIPPEDMDKIFMKYYTTDSRSHNNSTGLGLSIAKSIIERHLGSITVSSILNEGSTFTVCLPILIPDKERV